MQLRAGQAQGLQDRHLNASSWLSRLRDSASSPTFLGPDFRVKNGEPNAMTHSKYLLSTQGTRASLLPTLSSL